MNDCKLCRLPSPLFYAGRRAHARKFCSSDKKKENRPRGKPETPGRQLYHMKQHYLHAMTRAAGEPATKHRRARNYHGKVHPLPPFFPILAEKMHFFSEKCKNKLAIL